MHKVLILVAILFEVALIVAALPETKVDWSKVRPREVFPKGLRAVWESKKHLMGRTPGRIIGGDEVTPGKLPYQVALVINSFEFCGGSLISNLYVMTAAHCTERAYEIDVYLGAHNIREAEESGRQVIRVPYQNFIIHHAYDGDFFENDISLIMLNSRIEFTGKIQPIRLPTRTEAMEDLENWQVTASGWGRDSDSSFGISAVLRKTELQIQPRPYCEHFFSYVMLPTNICTSTGRGRGTCGGDSGGPLIVEKTGKIPYLVGVTSYGSSIGCVDAGWPSVYTHVSRYLNWIRDNTDIVIQE